MPIFQKLYIIPNGKINSVNTFMKVYETGDAKLLKHINNPMEFTVWGFIKIINKYKRNREKKRKLLPKQ